MYPAAKQAHNGQPEVNVMAASATKKVFSGQDSNAQRKSGEMEDHLA
jgi:hypothetical protein